MLAGIIQKLIREWHLKEFVQDKQKTPRTDNEPQKFPSNAVNVLEDEDPLNLSTPLNMIDVIHGGPQPAGNSKGARNKYIKKAREGVFSIQEEPTLKKTTT